MIHTFSTPETRWLSNFVTVEVTFRGRKFPTVEHAYMSAKIDDENWIEFCTSPARTASQIKQKTNEELLTNPNIVTNWEDIKIDVMRECLFSKYQQEPFKTKLIETGNQNIQEGNWWNDKFWGVDLKESPNVGENHLGRLIMEIREFISKNI